MRLLSWFLTFTTLHSFDEDFVAARQQQAEAPAVAGVFSSGLLLLVSVRQGE